MKGREVGEGGEEKTGSYMVAIWCLWAEAIPNIASVIFPLPLGSGS